MARSRAGRPRRTDVSRDEEGRIARGEYRREDVRTPAQWNRYRDVAKEMMLDERLATMRGKLFYRLDITKEQFEAANRWADMLEAYDVLILGRRRSPPSPALERLGLGQPSMPEEDRIQRFREAFKAAHDALVSGGKITEIAVTRLCRDEGTTTLFEHTTYGLDLLADHYGLTGKRKRA